ncbi:hypothetical protein FRB90_000233 [Tulasnella sp. 427]|nr:hypothetical protein FRB90_000233 [Tulasnella sp. 427]
MCAILQRKTPFYRDFSYLFNNSAPFQHAEELGTLTHNSLTAACREGDTVMRRIRRTLGGGQLVLVEDCPTPFDSAYVHSEDPVFSALTLPKNVALDAQDLVQWPANIPTTLDEFFRHRTNPAEILNLLDISANQSAGVSPWLCHLYDDRKARQIISSNSDCTIADIKRYPQWILLGHSFAHSFVHHDTTGLATHVTSASGTILWFALLWLRGVEIITPQMMDDRMTKHKKGELPSMEYLGSVPWLVYRDGIWIFDPEVYLARHLEFRDRQVARWVCVELGPGRSLLMPPTVPHLVYKASTALTLGGHGLIWEALPLSEIGCQLDHIDPYLANDVHPGMTLVHAAMALLLPERPEGESRLHVHPSAAHILTSDVQPMADALKQGRTRRELETLVRLVLIPESYRQAKRRDSLSDWRYWEPSAGTLQSKAQQRMRKYRDFLRMPDPPGITGGSFARLSLFPVREPRSPDPMGGPQ